MLAVLRPGGSGDHKSSVYANGEFAFAIDANPWNGANPCASIDATHIVNAGADHEVAVCTVNEPLDNGGVNIDNVSVFTFFLNWDPALNQCKTNPACAAGDKCLDDNPDVNAGSTLGTGHSPTTPNLGTGWDCSGFGLIQPTCSAGQAKADCLSAAGPYTSGGLSPFPLAIVSFTAIGQGVDTIVTSGNVWSGVDAGEFAPVSVSADVWKDITPTPSPTLTLTPVFTPTITPTPQPNADMGVTLADDLDPVVVGENVVYTATVTNNGPNLTTGVELVFTLPAEKLYVADSADCTCVYAAGPPETLTCDLGAMDDGDETDCTIMATALTEGIHETTASVSSALLPDLNPANDTASEETTEVLPHAYIDKVENGDGWCDPDFVDATSIEIVGDTHQLAVCVEYLPEDVSEFDLTISYNDLLDTCGDNEIACPVDTACLDDNPDANDGDMIEWGGVSLGDDWDCTAEGDVDEPTCNLNSEGTHGPHAGKAWISCHADLGSSTTLRAGALAVLTLDVAAAGEDDVEIYSLQIWGDEAIIAQCLPPTAPQGIVGAALPMDCDGATDTKVVSTPTPTATNTPTATRTPTITPTPEEETHKRETKTPTPAPTETATPVPPTVPPPPPPTATPLGGVGPEIIAPTTGSGSPVGGFTWAIWLAAGIAGAAAAGGFYFRYAKKAR
jgi:uncharacterized repeat protein (TIGR01451 family)